MRQILLILLTLFTPSVLLANPTITAPSTALGCKLTPTLSEANKHYPGQGNVIKSNKLNRPAGKSIFSIGKRLFFMGKILDENCVPVEGAHIELWQADSLGKYKTASKGQLASPNGIFAGSGTATTNNLGEFQFDTVFPGNSKNRAPHLSLKITHPDLTPLTTKVFFRNDKRNISDSTLMGLSPNLRERVMTIVNPHEINNTNQGLRAYIEIVLRGKEKFSQY